MSGAPAGTRPDETGPPALALDEVREVAEAICDSVARVVEGKDATIRRAVTVLLAGGHLLVEDVPGVGKTMLAKALARSIDASVRRIQFTPDLLPSDITGVNVFAPELRAFEFREGAVFANIVVGDEINRASPKAQSALLEAMEERQVTVDGTTYRLPDPFMVVATQNPIEMEGTYPLPEAQRDRFMAQLSMGYPGTRSEVEMLRSHGASDPLDEVAPVTDAATVAALVAAVREVWAAPAVLQYVVDLASATRSSPLLRLGASPRATLHLVRAARAHAALQGRDHVLPDDIRELCAPVLGHRLLLSSEARLGRRSATEVVADLVARVPVPAGVR